MADNLKNNNFTFCVKMRIIKFAKAKKRSCLVGVS